MTSLDDPWSRRTAGAVTTVGTAGVLALTGLLAVPSPADAASPARGTATTPAVSGTPAVGAVRPGGSPWPGHPGRRLLRYRVHRGDTATGLAVRFHAWTAELRAVNGLGPDAGLRVGQRIRIPVVVAAARRDHRHHTRPHHTRPHHTRPHHGRPARPKPWRQADATRAQVRSLIVRTARRHRVDPALVLAIAWQESGWQQRRRSSAGAIGAMQVLPGTGRWMSLYADRRLNIYSLRDNVTAGVLLVDVLRRHTSHRGAIAAYYQGLGAMRRRGVFPATRTYLRNVLALERRLRRGWSPL